MSAAPPEFGGGDSAASESFAHLPRHVAFIMDGNGRWARQQGFARLIGHERGADSLRAISRRSRALGIEEITFYALSSENWQRRPRRELNYLMQLLKKFLVGERPELLDNDIRLRSIGDVEVFPDAVLRALRETEALTADRTQMTMRLALNYGSRQEILGAARAIAERVCSGELPGVEAVDEETLRRHFYDPEMSDPDLLIRTAGEYRLSNFLLWQCSYAEFWVTDTLWPDFDVAEYERALEAYAQRERKYGAVGRDPEAAREGPSRGSS